VSFVLHRDTPKTLGWRADNLRPHLDKRRGFWSLHCGVGAAGLYLGAAIYCLRIFWIRIDFFGYFAFCLLQQIALNFVLMDRLLYAVERPMVAPFLRALFCFAALA